jgi:glutamine amidotransferase
VTFTAEGLGSPLLEDVASPEPRYFYHVHSYARLDTEDISVLGVCDYGEPFATIVGRENVWGAQFHPEKSQEMGLAILRNFARM